jgi:hypothetical protein
MFRELTKTLKANKEIIFQSLKLGLLLSESTKAKTTIEAETNQFH